MGPGCQLEEAEDNPEGREARFSPPGDGREVLNGSLDLDLGHLVGLDLCLSLDMGQGPRPGHLYQGPVRGTQGLREGPWYDAPKAIGDQSKQRGKTGRGVLSRAVTQQRESLALWLSPASRTALSAGKTRGRPPEVGGDAWQRGPGGPNS